MLRWNLVGNHIRCQGYRCILVRAKRAEKPIAGILECTLEVKNRDVLKSIYFDQFFSP